MKCCGKSFVVNKKLLFVKTIEKGQDQIGIDIPGNL